MREALNNCIAHQGYSYNSRINVIEMEDQLIFSNRGSFIPGSVENVIMNNAPEERYRNTFLATAMFNLNMVDTIGSGIRKMYNYQKERFFPLPEYEITNDRIIVTITGKVIDLEYARTLAQNPDLTLEEIIMLDKVQKHKKLLPNEIKLLKNKKLIEGRSPNFFVAKSIADVTNEKAKYIRNIAFDNNYYKSLVLALIGKYGHATREEID
ncbi:MAG: ATP-binding protein [Bacteroidota bacterium]